MKASWLTGMNKLKTNEEKTEQGQGRKWKEREEMENWESTWSEFLVDKSREALNWGEGKQGKRKKNEWGSKERKNSAWSQFLVEKKLGSKGEWAVFSRLPHSLEADGRWHCDARMQTTTTQAHSHFCSREKRARMRTRMNRMKMRRKPKEKCYCQCYCCWKRKNLDYHCSRSYPHHERHWECCSCCYCCYCWRWWSWSWQWSLW